MVPGIESLQILYGEDTDADGLVNHYVPYVTGLLANPLNILSVKVSIIARSANPIDSLDTGTTTKTYYHFGADDRSKYIDPSSTSAGTTFPAPDKRLRLQPMSTEIAVRNFGYCGGN